MNSPSFSSHHISASPFSQYPLFINESHSISEYIHSSSALLERLTIQVLSHEEVEFVFEKYAYGIFDESKGVLRPLLHVMFEKLINETDAKKIEFFGINFSRLCNKNDLNKINDFTCLYTNENYDDLLNNYTESIVVALSQHYFDELQLTDFVHKILLKLKFIPFGWNKILDCFSDNYQFNDSTNLSKNFDFFMQIMICNPSEYDPTIYDLYLKIFDEKFVKAVDTCFSQKIGNQVQFFLDNFSSYIITRNGEFDGIKFQSGDHLLNILMKSFFYGSQDYLNIKLENLRAIDDFIFLNEENRIKYSWLQSHKNEKNRGYRDIIEYFIFSHCLNSFFTDFNSVQFLLPHLLSFKSIKYKKMSGNNLCALIMNKFRRLQINKKMLKMFYSNCQNLNEQQKRKPYPLSALKLFQEGNDFNDQSVFFRTVPLKTHIHILKQPGNDLEDIKLKDYTVYQIVQKLFYEPCDSKQLIQVLKKAIYIRDEKSGTFLHIMAKEFANNVYQYKDLKARYDLILPYLCEDFINFRNEEGETYQCVFFKENYFNIKEYFSKFLEKGFIEQLVIAYSNLERDLYIETNGSFLHTLFRFLLTFSNREILYANLQKLHDVLVLLIEKNDSQSKLVYDLLKQKNLQDETFLESLEDYLFSIALGNFFLSPQGQINPFVAYLLDMRATKAYALASKGETLYQAFCRIFEERRLYFSRGDAFLQEIIESLRKLNLRSLCKLPLFVQNDLSSLLPVDNSFDNNENDRSSSSQTASSASIPGELQTLSWIPYSCSQTTSLQNVHINDIPASQKECEQSVQLLNSQSINASNSRKKRAEEIKKLPAFDQMQKLFFNQSGALSQEMSGRYCIKAETKSSGNKRKASELEEESG